MNRVSAVVLALASGGLFASQRAAADAFNTVPYLEPVREVIWDRTHGYEINVRNLLLGDLSDEPCARLVGMPDRSGEWVLDLQRSTDGPASLVLREVIDGQIWDHESRIKIETHRVRLADSTARSLAEAWLKLLHDVRYPSSYPPLSIHGTRYIFSAWERGLGTLYGEADSPDPSSPAGGLVRIGELLKTLVVAKEAKRGALEIEIRQMASELAAEGK